MVPVSPTSCQMSAKSTRRRLEPEDEPPQSRRPFDPDHFSRREVNARLRQYARGEREWLFS